MARREINPTALSIKAFVSLMHAAGSKVITAKSIRDDIKERGAPVNDDGTINLVDFAAWIILEEGRVRN